MEDSPLKKKRNNTLVEHCQIKCRASYFSSASSEIISTKPLESASLHPIIQSLDCKGSKVEALL